MAVTMNLKGTSNPTFKVGNATLDSSGVSSKHTLSLPNKSGTLATLDDITGGTGGTQNIDGGAALTVFLVDQGFDGGTASTIYDPSDIVDGGLAN